MSQLEAPLGRNLRVGALFFLLLSVVAFVRTTLPVRIANSDDRRFSDSVRSPTPGQTAELFRFEALRESRFYFVSPVYQLPYAIYRIDNPVAFATARALLLYFQFAVLGWLVARLTGNEPTGWLVLLLAAGALHIPSIFNPILSYPAYAAGGILLLIALVSFQIALDRQSMAWSGAAAALFLAALSSHENFLVFVTLFPVMAWAVAPPFSSRKILRWCWPVFAAATAYAAIYLVFRAQHPSSYAGTQVSSGVTETMVAYLRQTLAAIPGFELLINRAAPYPNVGPTWKTSAEVTGIIRSLTPSELALALGDGVLVTLFAARAYRSGSPTSRQLAVFGLGAALPNLAPSLTQKYQVASHHRLYPYVYSFTAYCFAVVVVVFLVIWALRRLQEKPGQVRFALVVFGLLASAAFASAFAANDHTLGLLHRWFD